MLILAGIALNLTLGDDGIFSRANKSRIEYDIAQTKERLDLIFVDAYAEKKVNPEYNQNDFLDDYIYSKNKEVIMEEDMVTLNGYTFELNRSVPEVGEYIGEAGNLPPRITRIEVIEKGMTNVKVEVTVARAEGVTYRYSYKKLEEEEFTQAGEEETNTYEYTGLESAKIYTIKVELIKENVIVDSEEIEVMPGELEEGAITFGTPVWTSGKAEVTISTNTEYRIQYQIGGIEGSWNEVTNGGKVSNIQNGQTIYARLFDGTNGGEYTSIKVEDSINPTINNIEEVEVTETSIKIRVDAVDEESGIGKIEYSKDNGASYVTGTTNTQTEYTFEDLDERVIYQIKIRVTDNAGNISEQMKEIETAGERFSEIYEETADYTDKYGNVAKIPGGFAVGIDEEINDVTDGLVIRDEQGNKFVWVPIGKVYKNEAKEYEEINLGRYTFAADGTPTLAQSTDDYMSNVPVNSSYYEIVNSTYGNMPAKDLGDFITKAKNAGGYYIGRFEAGKVEGNTNTFNIKKRQEVYGRITQANAATLARNLYSNNSNVESDLTNSYAWDTAIVFIQKFSGDTDYSKQNRVQATFSTTGTAHDSNNNYDVRCNIYDMAGNAKEWSTETSSVYGFGQKPNVTMGGWSGQSETYTSYRIYYGLNEVWTEVGFRPIIYL